MSDLLVALCHNAPFLQNNKKLCERIHAKLQQDCNKDCIAMWEKLIILSKNFLLHCTNQSSLIWSNSLILDIKNHLKTSFQHIRSAMSVVEKVNDLVCAIVDSDWHDETYIKIVYKILSTRDAFIKSLYDKRTNGATMIDNQCFFLLSTSKHHY